MLRKIFLSIFAILVFIGLLFSFSFSNNNNQFYKSKGGIQYLKIADTQIKVDLAKTPAEQTKGLSGRAGLNKDEGMLFIFDNPGVYAFWMKDMKFALDIIWLAEDGEVVYIKKEARPESYPETFVSLKNAKYVLEVMSGFSTEHNLKEGDKVKFVY